MEVWEFRIKETLKITIIFIRMGNCHFKTFWPKVLCAIKMDKYKTEGFLRDSDFFLLDI